MSGLSLPVKTARCVLAARLREFFAPAGAEAKPGAGPAERIFRQADRALRLAAGLSAGLGGCFLLLMLGVTCAGIVMRGLGGNLNGAVEIAGCLCALAVGLCLPAAQYAGSHVEVGVMAERLPKAARTAMRAPVNLACAAVLLLMAVELRELASYTVDIGETIEGFPFSSACMTLGLALGATLHAGIFILELLRAVLPAGRRVKAEEGASS